MFTYIRQLSQITKFWAQRGSRSCIARIAVNSGYGSILTNQHSGHVLDYISCGGVTLKTLSFELRNANNEVVDMRGGHVSFSIIFQFSSIGMVDDGKLK